MIEVAEIARAYSNQSLMHHEIVKDVVGAKPLSATSCSLCNAGIVFDRRLDRRILDFGATGGLRKSDLVIYDRQTQSWPLLWHGHRRGTHRLEPPQPWYHVLIHQRHIETYITDQP